MNSLGNQSMDSSLRNFCVITASIFAAVTIQFGKAHADNSTPANNVGPPIEGKFNILTDELYATARHHVSDTLSFADYYEWKRQISGDYGIDFVLLNTPIFQSGTTNGEIYLDNEMDIHFQWRAIENENTTGKVFFWGLWVQTFTDLPSGAFAKSQGTFTLPNGGATDPGKSVVAPSALWWDQSFEKSGFEYRLGQLYAASLWGANAYLGDDRATFMNTTLSTNQGTPWSGGNRGLGAMATLSSDDFYLSFGFQDAKGDQKKIDFKSFGDGKFSYLGEIGLTPNFDGKNPGVYKLTVGRVDKTGNGESPTEKDGWGLTLSAQQDIGDEVGLFAIFRHSWDRYISNTEIAAGAGVVWKAPFGWGDDKLGLGAFFARPHDTKEGELQDEWGVEAFWRLQMTPRLDMSPDLQLYLQPGRKKQKDPIAIFGLRARYVM